MISYKLDMLLDVVLKVAVTAAVLAVGYAACQIGVLAGTYNALLRAFSSF